MQMILAGTLNTHDVHQYEAPLDKSWYKNFEPFFPL